MAFEEFNKFVQGKADGAFLSNFELINGTPTHVSKPVKNSNYEDVLNRMIQPICTLFDNRTHTMLTHSLLFLDEQNNVRPDVMVVLKSSVFSDKENSYGTKALLVAEVMNIGADGLDAHKRANIYAKYGVPEYWLRNLTGHCLELYQKPRGGRYQIHNTLYANESFHSVHDQKPQRQPINVIP